MYLKMYPSDNMFLGWIRRFKKWVYTYPNFHNLPYIDYTLTDNSEIVGSI